jgi:acetolactate synthase-1/2/3 large subunit
VAAALRAATGTQPGPVYLDMPGDVLFRDVPEDKVRWTTPPAAKARPHGDPALIAQAVEVLASAERPVVIYGTGVLWSEADQALGRFVDRFGIPFWSTPQGRGAVPEDHPLSLLAVRSSAFRDCDVIVQVATRQSYVIEHARPPRWSADAKLIQIDTDVQEIGRNRQPEVGIVGDARSVLDALVSAAPKTLQPEQYRGWVDRLRASNKENLVKAEAKLSTDAVPIHPQRLCKEVRDWLPRDAVLVVDGQEILNFARQTIPFYRPRSLNSGPYGCMGVGLPLAIGAKAALPDATVVVLHGDGSFGLNAMEFDTAVRHKLPVICVISNNGGWSAGNTRKAGRDLGFTRYDQMFAPLGLFTRHVENPADLRAALDAALASGKSALINVVTDSQARAGGTAFTKYVT